MQNGDALGTGTVKKQGKGQWTGRSADGKFIGLGLHGRFKARKWDIVDQLTHHWGKSDSEGSNTDGRDLKAKNVKSSVLAAEVLEPY